jgi:Tfp pilus assembly protein PilN
MKQSINLLSRDILYKEAEVSAKPILLPLAVLAAVVLLGVWYAMSLKEIRQKESRLQVLTTDKQQLDREASLLANQLQALEADRRPGIPVAQQQLKAIDDRMKTRIYWSEILRQISLLTPEGVFFTRVESARGGVKGAASQEEKRVRFVGYAWSHAPVTTLIGALEQSESFDSVALIYLQRTSEADNPRVAFELTARLREKSG